MKNISVLYLTKTDGVVVRLGPCVEVNSLFNIIMSFIVPGQVVECCPIPRVIGDLRCLVNNSNIVVVITVRPFYEKGWTTVLLPFECFPCSRKPEPERDNPEPIHSSAELHPCQTGSLDTVPTIYRCS